MYGPADCQYAWWRVLEETYLLVGDPGCFGDDGVLACCKDGTMGEGGFQDPSGILYAVSSFS